MNEYQKAIKRGIEKGLDKHFKDEPKVWLTVEEAKALEVFADDVMDLDKKGYIHITDEGFETISFLKKRIEQAEKQK